MGTKKTYQFLVLFPMVFLLTACRDSPITQNLQSTDFPSPVAMAKTLAADPDYLKECRQSYTTKMQEQQAYRGILPGKTTSSTVISILGTPREKSPGFESNSSDWEYGKFKVSFRADIVDFIFVMDDEQLTFTLEDLLKKYGCPQLIFARNNVIDQSPKGYNVTRFAYFKNGFEVDFYSFPTSLSDTSGGYTFYKPQSLENYLDLFGYAKHDFSQEMPVEWNEAIKQ